jgi:hypothetical protein
LKIGACLSCANDLLAAALGDYVAGKFKARHVQSGVELIKKRPR